MAADVIKKCGRYTFVTVFVALLSVQLRIFV